MAILIRAPIRDNGKPTFTMSEIRRYPGKQVCYWRKIIHNLPYSKTTALGGVETGRQNAIETDTAQGIIKYIGFIWRRSAISHNRDAKIVIVDEFDVTCVIRLIISTHKSNINGCERPKFLIVKNQRKIWWSLTRKTGHFCTNIFSKTGWRDTTCHSEPTTKKKYHSPAHFWGHLFPCDQRWSNYKLTIFVSLKGFLCW